MPGLLRSGHSGATRLRFLLGKATRLGRFAARLGGLGTRGATSAIIATSASVLLGMAALATEGGSWYLARRNAVTAADLAALAGAAALDRGSAALPVAFDTASRNGFANGGRNTIAVNSPPASGAYAGNAYAVEVTIAQTQTMSLSRLFLAAAPTVRARAVAAAQTYHNVCLLALGGGLELGGNSTTNIRSCMLGSNAAAPGGINIFGSARVRTAGLITTGTCSGCSGSDVWTDDTRTVPPQVVSNRPDPITDPFANLQNWTPSPPSCRSNAIDLTGANNSNRTASITAVEGAICTSLTVGPMETLNLAPGLYYFNGASLAVQGTISGSGVTLVFTGNANNVGTIRINAGSNSTLSGPQTSLIPGHPEAAGLVVYRDAVTTNNGNANEIRLNGGANMSLVGGLYFPTSDVIVNGNSGTTASSCMAVIGYRLSFSGTADTEVDVSGCPGFSPYPTIRTVRLVE
jgi:hypothetical protein